MFAVIIQLLHFDLSRLDDIKISWQLIVIEEHGSFRVRLDLQRLK